MNSRCVLAALVLVSMSAVRGLGSEEPSSLVESALARSGDNALQIRKALDEVPEDQQEGMRFLVAHMPERDLTSLSADFLLKHVKFAYLAWNEAAWKDRLPKDVFLNDVLPYAVINERRDDWREDFYGRFKPLVVDADSPSQAAVILNQKIFRMLDVRFSRQRPKADQSPYETIEASMASCTGLSVLLVDACRAVGVPARFAGTPLWTNKSGNHSWVEIWDGDWHYTGAAENTGDELNRGWFSGRTGTAQRDHRLHAIYATSFKPTPQTFPLVWDREIDYVYAVNVTDRYVQPAETDGASPRVSENSPTFDVEASMHALAQLETYLKSAPADRPALTEQGFATVALTREHAQQAEQLLWTDHVEQIQETRAEEMKARRLTVGDSQMPFYYTVSGDRPSKGRSLYISLHGGGNAPAQVNDRQWENQKKLYSVEEGVYVAPRAPTNTWDLWHQGHIDVLFDRLIENLIVFEQVDPNRVYLLGYSAGGDGVYQLAPRMADRFAGAAMMAGHPNEALPQGLRNVAFTIHVGGKDSAYGRNNIARQWGKNLAALQQDDPNGYVHWVEVHEGKGHWLDRKDAAALPWMSRHNRNPLPSRVVWRQDNVTHPRFYWLAVNPDDQRGGTEVRASYQGQAFEVEANGIEQLMIRVNDRMLNLDEEITVTSSGKELFRGRVPRSIGTLAKTLAERSDPTSVFSGEIVVATQKKE
ncbi:transglutaminase domain-containing protein [Pirellulales bacterium]|nr:transglutaminase domain-containing protein [Pirellulales bacterium]